MKFNIVTKLVLIITVCSAWIILIPGLVAYQNKVYHGSMFKDKIPDSVIVSRIMTGEIARKYYAENKLVKHKGPKKETIVTFSGFADRGFKYVWLESYIILCLYAFVLYYPYAKQALNRKTIILFILIYLLVQAPVWIRNISEIGKYGATIYSYTNYEIDRVSFWLQELRGAVFSFLIAVFWHQFELRRHDSLKVIRYSIGNFGTTGILELSTQVKLYFNYWQRDILISILLFLPWTWLYWKDIFEHGDTRFIFSAIVFHSFWLISIILISRPFITLHFNYWNYRNKLIWKDMENGSHEKMLSYLDTIDPLPKGQFFLTSVTTALSLLSPFLQAIFEST